MSDSFHSDEVLIDEQLHAEIHTLVTDVIENVSSDSANKLSALLAEGDEQVGQCYISYMHETDALRRAGLAASQLLPHFNVTPEGPNDASSPTNTQKLPTKLLGVFFAVAASLAVGFAFWPHSKPSDLAEDGIGSEVAADTQGIATLVRVTRVEWHEGEVAVPELSRLSPGQRIRIDSGQIELLFDTGVELVIAGPADATVDSSMLVVGTLGKYLARVSERGRGFTIETPATHVIDLGTEFGVEIAASGSTKVAVFKGAVDLDFSGVLTPEAKNAEDRVLERLGVGEALLINSSGERSRIVTIGSEDFPKPGTDRPDQARRPSLFASVSDNIRSPSGKKFYRIVRDGLFDDARAYVDREHEWNGLDRHGLPEELQNADYLMTFNDDKFRASFELTVELSAPCTLYVLFDNNMVAPDWLLDDFQDTGIDIGLDQASGRYSGASKIATGGGMSIDDTFSVWSRSVDSAQSLTLGGVEEPSDIEAGWNMYGVAAAPAPGSQTDR